MKGAMKMDRLDQSEIYMNRVRIYSQTGMIPEITSDINELSEIAEKEG